MSGVGAGWIVVSSPNSNDRASSSRVTPAGSVSSIGRIVSPRLVPGSGRGGTAARCRAETGTVGACPTVAAKFGDTRMRVAWLALASSAMSGRVAAGGVSPAGRGMMIVRSSPGSGSGIGAGKAAGRAPETAGIAGIVPVFEVWSGSISSVSGRSKSVEGGCRRLASPTGSSIGGGGTYGAGVGGVKTGRSPLREAAAGGAGGVYFSGSMTVLPLEWSCNTSQSFISSSAGGQTSAGAVPGSSVEVGSDAAASTAGG